MSSRRPYKPDVAYANLDTIVDIVLRNLDDIARVINRDLTADDIDFSGFSFPSTGGDVEEKNYFVKKWRVEATEEIPSDEIYATTGIVFGENGIVRINGELKEL